MSIIAYDPNNLKVYGSFYLQGLSGTSEFNFWENIAVDLASVPAFAELESCYVIGWATPFIKVTNGLNELGFTSVPEGRYKIGSYSYGCGYEIEVNADMEIIATMVRSTPHYIVYPTQCLEIGRFAFETPEPIVQQFEVSFNTSPTGGNDIWILNARQNSSNSPNNLLASGITVNLTAPIIADIKIYYSAGITALQYFADNRDFQPILV